MNWQNKNNRNFQCKFESKCEITIKNRKTCQSCRFKVSCLSWRGQSTWDVLSPWCNTAGNEVLRLNWGVDP